MDGIKIVEYQPRYAKTIANMWNQSAEAWGGSSSIKTEEAVLKEHENSVDLNVFLALRDEEVVGYCSFSEYRFDEGALYIPLLNVRPDYHGSKIGKLLVLKAVEKTIELGWPRLDLFTWPGNTKAVPLYKKCGFFWEKRDDSTHLMNFIPQVLSTEAIKDYFQTIDWYNDSKRPIEVKEDGLKDNGFEYFQYLWEKNAKLLRVEFERRGRGISLIETEEYLIGATAEGQELVFGREYSIKYRVVNKSSRPLNISIVGKDDKNIKFDFNRTIDVMDNETIEGKFYVGEIEEEQNIWKTHPAVCSEVMINGKKATFKLGIVPLFPAKISINVPGRCHTGLESICYMDIQNNFDEEAIFELALPSTGEIAFSQNSINIKVPAKGRKSVELSYVLKEFNYYNQAIPTTAKLQSGSVINFNYRLQAFFAGNRAMMGGATEKGYIIFNGSYSIEFDKVQNAMTPVYAEKEREEDYETAIIYPKLGKPFSYELGRNKPEKIECYQEDQAMVLKITYKSREFKDIEINSIAKLYADGIMEQNYEIYNMGDKETAQEIWVSQTMLHNLFRGVIPYQGKYIELDNDYGTEASYWDSNQITENWLFSKSDATTRGICWDKDYQMDFDRWMMSIKHNLGRMAARSCRVLKPVYIAIGTFTDWQQFRAFALQKSKIEYISTTEDIELVVNDNNPFVKDNFEVRLRENKNAFIDGTITLNNHDMSSRSISKIYQEKDEIKEAVFGVEVDSYKNIDLIDLKADLQAIEFNRKALIFNTKGSGVRSAVLKEKDMDIYCVDNGTIKIKAAPGFSNSLHSIEFKGNEWLDSAFPKPAPKSWWNPWVGGIQMYPSELRSSIYLREKTSGEFVELKDSKCNIWKGIKLTTTIENLEEYKGLQVNQYYLLQPNAPVLCYTAQIVQNTGRLLKDVDFATECFFKTGDSVNTGYFALKNSQGDMLKFKAGKADNLLQAYSPVVFGSTDREEKLLVITDLNNSLMHPGLNNEIIDLYGKNRITAKDGDMLFIPPMFFIFTQQFIEYHWMKDLINISF